MEQVKTPQVLKPNFEKLAKAYVTELYGHCDTLDLPDRLRYEGYIAGMEKIWNDYANQFKEENARLREACSDWVKELESDDPAFGLSSYKRDLLKKMQQALQPQK